jgi:SAM-dependent methyltransferase
MKWNDGYVADIDYPSGFFEEQSPAYLHFACVLNGYEPVALDAPFSYCELGSGRGLTANLLAASNPQGDFYAVDFLPSHVAGARQLARAAQLDNLTLLEDSFADLAEGRVAGLPQFDFITLHGVYTWVTADNRGHIVDFIKRYLKPGGIVYVSYNALPGWNATLPLQRLMLEHADRHPGRSGAQLEGARQFIDTLRATKAGYFGAHQPRLQHRLDSLKTDNANYLAHEYMNRGSPTSRATWRPPSSTMSARRNCRWPFPTSTCRPSSKPCSTACPTRPCVKPCRTICSTPRSATTSTCAARGA